MSDLQPPLTASKRAAPVIRILRLLRVFRVLRLVRFTTEGQLLVHALKASACKIGVFILFMLTIAVLLSTLMYVVDRGNPGFVSIPSSIYWGIVTITTVGFGDIVPHTFPGKFITSFISNVSTRTPGGGALLTGGGRSFQAARFPSAA